MVNVVAEWTPSRVASDARVQGGLGWSIWAKCKPMYLSEPIFEPDWSLRSRYQSFRCPESPSEVSSDSDIRTKIPGSGTQELVLMIRSVYTLVELYTILEWKEHSRENISKQSLVKWRQKNKKRIPSLGSATITCWSTREMRGIKRDGVSHDEGLILMTRMNAKFLNRKDEIVFVDNTYPWWWQRRIVHAAQSQSFDMTLMSSNKGWGGVRTMKGYRGKLCKVKSEKKKEKRLNR